MGVVPNDISGYSLVLTNKVVSVNSDGQRHFDLGDNIQYFHNAIIFFHC